MNRLTWLFQSKCSGTTFHRQDSYADIDTLINEIKKDNLRACLHEGGGPQIGEVTCGGLPHLTCKRDHIKMRDYIDRWVTPPKRVTSRTWGPPPPYKHALHPVYFYLFTYLFIHVIIRFSLFFLDVVNLSYLPCKMSLSLFIE